MKKRKFISCIAVLLLAVMFLSACGEKEKKEVEYFYSPGDAFITNVFEAEGKLVKANVTLVMRRDYAEKLTEKNAGIRDCVISIMRSTPLDALQAPNAQEMLAEKIIAQMNEMFPLEGEDLGVPLFTKVYFEELVVT